MADRSAGQPPGGAGPGKRGLELAQAGWLQAPGTRPGTVTAYLLDATVLDQAPGRGERHRAAHWALRPAPLVLPAAEPAALRLTALVLASHCVGSSDGTGEMAAVSRLCGHHPQQTKELLDRLVAARTLVSWRYHPDSGEVLWRFPQQSPPSMAEMDSQSCNGPYPKRQ